MNLLNHLALYCASPGLHLVTRGEIDGHTNFIVTLVLTVKRQPKSRSTKMILPPLARQSDRRATFVPSFGVTGKRVSAESIIQLIWVTIN